MWLCIIVYVFSSLSMAFTPVLDKILRTPLIKHVRYQGKGTSLEVTLWGPHTKLHEPVCPWNPLENDHYKLHNEGGGDQLYSNVKSLSTADTSC